jgi:hypothetical protein
LFDLRLYQSNINGAHFVWLYGLLATILRLFLSLFISVAPLTHTALQLATDRGLTDTNGVGNGLLTTAFLLSYKNLAEPAPLHRVSLFVGSLILQKASLNLRQINRMCSSVAFAILASVFQHTIVFKKTGDKTCDCTFRY